MEGIELATFFREKADRLRQALVRITNLSGGAGIEEAKKIASQTLDIIPWAPPETPIASACTSEASAPIPSSLDPATGSPIA
jgi:hypothetical protein